MANNQHIIDVDDKVNITKAIPLGIQHMMSMFGSTVLVPVLTGLHPSVAIMCSGIGTICYLLITKNKIPSYLGSSFAFISPIIAVGATQGLGAALSGVVVAGIVFLLTALLIKFIGTSWMNRILPPVLVAAVIVVIGVGLSATAVKMALYGGKDTFDIISCVLAGITLFSAVAFSATPGFIGTMPVLMAIIVGYISSAFFRVVNFDLVVQAPWIGLPTLNHPTFNWGAIILIAPVAVVVVIEHIGHLLVVSEVVNRDYKKLLPRSLAGDGIATCIAGFLGGPPTTTYAENIGVMSVTKVYSTQVFWYAAGFAFIVGGFCPKLEALIESIPVPVMGGVSLLLFGLIASNGLRTLVSNRVDFSENRNLMIASIVIILGVGMECAGVAIPIGSYLLPGMATSAIIGIVLNLILPGKFLDTSSVSDVIDL